MKTILNNYNCISVLIERINGIFNYNENFHNIKEKEEKKLNVRENLYTDILERLTKKNRKLIILLELHNSRSKIYRERKTNKLLYHEASKEKVNTLFNLKGNILKITTSTIKILEYLNNFNIEILFVRGRVMDETQKLFNDKFKKAKKISTICTTPRFCINTEDENNEYKNIKESDFKNLFPYSYLNFYDKILVDGDITYKKLREIVEDKNKIDIIDKYNYKINDNECKNKRNYDIIYTSGFNCCTKGIDFFLEFLKYLKKNNSNIKICLINEDMFEKFYMKGRRHSIKEVKEINYKNIDIIINPDNIDHYYNDSKIHLLTSSRDAQPRTISESMYNGCFNLITSTLVEGKHLVNDYTGLILKTKNIFDNENECYEPDPKNNRHIFNKIIEYTKMNIDNELVKMSIKNIASPYKIINKINNVKYLFISYNLPGSGGASTNLYKIYEEFQKIYPCYILFIKSKNEKNDIIFESKVKNSENIYIIKEKDEKNNKNIINELKDKIGKTNIKIFFKIFKTYSNVIEKYFNDIKNSELIYLVSGSYIINKYLDKYVSNNIDFMIDDSKNVLSKKQIDDELNTLKKIDKIIYNSELTQKIFKKKINYFKVDNTIEDILSNTSLISVNKITECVPKFEERENDVLYVTTTFTRTVKNPNFALDLFNSDKLLDFKKIIIGKKFEYLERELPPNTKHIEWISDIYSILKNTKLIIIPSIYDSSPNIFYEAIMCGCNVLVSKNVGVDKNIINDNNILDFDYNNWESKIKEKLDKSYGGIEINFLKKRKMEELNKLLEI
jgi:hypothetical protein